jgi:hypothetical protein
MKFYCFLLVMVMSSHGALGESLECDLHEMKALDGLAAAVTAGELQVSWRGERGQPLRAVFAVVNGQPRIRELAVRNASGNWVVLARDVSPEFEVVSGRRRLSEQQAAPLRALGIRLTPDVIEREKWNAFWDAPLEVPGAAGANLDLPRTPQEIRRASVRYDVKACRVKSDGARLEVTFPGLSLGIFAGELRFTVYRGANLLRQEAIAKTDEPSVAYKYNAGLKGFSIRTAPRVVWQDVARAWQQYEFGGGINRDPVALRARNRLVIVEAPGGSLAIFPPPHKFFFAREIELNLGYVWYRKDDDRTFSAGVRQAEHEEEYRPFGVSEKEWQRRASESRHNLGNFALYNAPPGTWQRMPVYYYLSADDSRTTQSRVLAFTHNDTFKPMPGYQVAVSHFHTRFTEMLEDAGTLDLQPGFVPVFRGLGINIAMMSDFHGDEDPNDPGPLRFREQKDYFDGCRRFSDRTFLIMPGEEPDGALGGHYTFVFPKPVYWSRVRQSGQPYTELDPQYGKVYHTGSAADELQLLRDENGLMWQTHPRTKGSTGYPDAVRNWDHFKSDQFLGASYQSLPVDQSEARICEKRCFGVLDDMNNWAGPKYLIAEGDTYLKYPDDETYPQLIVNYLKLASLPGFDEDWNPIFRAMRAGDFYVSTGEVLLRNYAIEGTGAQRTFTAEAEWTFPLEFVELVWSDGTTVDREILSETSLAPFGHQRFTLPFDAAGKKWIRFAIWDSAGDGAFTQPVHLR